MHQVRRATRRVRARRRHRPDDVRRPASRGSMMALLGYLIRRVFRAITTLLGTTLILFVLVRVVPANPAVSIAGPKADPETLAAIRKDLGLDDPLAVQYGRYLERLVHGDLGRSYLTGRRVTEAIGERLPATAKLGLTALAVGFFLGLLIGIVTAARQGSAADIGVLIATLVGLSIPTFWLGNVLIYFFGYRLRWLPLGGAGALRHLVLPAATLAIVELFFYARF
ncbi:MAG: ABC transporter permease, partial [Deltaproteobacteria bacterium]